LYFGCRSNLAKKGLHLRKEIRDPRASDPFRLASP
jgi:hypothetical protein